MIEVGTVAISSSQAALIFGEQLTSLPGLSALTQLWTLKLLVLRELSTLLPDLSCSQCVRRP